jgi:glycosyltransferase involved in cell wall biosynthesis
LFKKNDATSIIHSAVEHADMVIARMPSMAGAIAIKHARMLNKPYLVEMVACTFDAYWNYSWKGKFIAHYKYYRTQQIIRVCPHVVYVTKNFLQERYPSMGAHVGVSDVALSAQPAQVLEQRIERIKSRSATAPLVLGTVAAIDVPYKGQKDVVRAVAELKRRGYNVNYHMVGQGNPKRLFSIIQNLGVENEVRIVGALKHNEVFDFLKTLDVYIQPSKQEGLPRAMLEAMSVALPALGSRVGGMPELLDSSCLFKPGDVSQIVETVEGLTPERLIKQATRNFHTTLEYYPEILDQRRTAFYQQFLAHTANA